MTTAISAPHHHPAWRKALLAAPLPGLPLLAGEFALFGTEGCTSGFETVLARPPSCSPSPGCCPTGAPRGSCGS